MKQSNRKLFISNSVFNIGFNLLNQIIALFILPLFVKNLGAELYGIWILSGIVIGYLGLFELGFSNGVTKYVAEAYTKKNFAQLSNVINTGIGVFFGVGLCICLIITFFVEKITLVFSINPSDLNAAQTLLLVTALFALIAWPMKITDVVFKGTLRFKELSILNAVKSIGKTIVMLYCVWKGFNIISIAIISNISVFILWIPALVVMLRRISGISFGIKFLKLGIIKEMAPFSLGVFYSQLLSIAALQVDNLIIGAFLSMSAVTAYTVASKLFYITYKYLGMLSGVQWPTIFTAHAEGNNNLIEKMLFKGTKYMAIIIGPIAYLGILISPMFIKLWMGQNYAQYAIWSQIFMLVYLIGGGFGIAPNIARAQGKQKLFNTLGTINVIMNIVLSLLLVRKYGIGGPILATVITSVAFGGPIFFPIYCKLINMEWKKTFLIIFKIHLSNLPSFCLFYWFINEFHISNFLGLIIISLLFLLIQYGTLYYLFFGVDERRDIIMMVESVIGTKMFAMIRTII